jgi:hypothetical protein
VYEYNGEPFTKTMNVGVLANGVSEGSAEPLTARLKTQTLNGFVALSKDGAFTYSPATDMQMSGGGNDSVKAASADVTTLEDVTTMQGAGLIVCFVRLHAVHVLLRCARQSAATQGDGDFRALAPHASAAQAAGQQQHSHNCHSSAVYLLASTCAALRCSSILLQHQQPATHIPLVSCSWR